jgi:CubicO group peptidase (beta-lactamase class C family)
VISAKPVLRVGLTTFGLLVVWVAVVFLGTSEGWWKKPLAPRGDSAAFIGAAIRTIDGDHSGNAVMAVIGDGTVQSMHAASIGAAVDADTVFQTASLSKWLTAWGVMALVEKGKLDLDAPVSRYLKRWTLPTSAFDNDQVTARRLLSHTAGLTDGLGYAGFAPGTPVQSLEASLAQAADASPGAKGKVEVGIEPGTGWRYSGGGYAVLQLLIEDLSGEPFEAYMQRVVFKPLGMVHSTFHWSAAQGTTLATFYGKDAQPATHFRFSAVAASSLYTSVSDLTRFLQAQLPGNRGEPIGRGVLAPTTVAQMSQPTGALFGLPIWGLGTMLYADNRAGGFIVGHDGSNEPAINTAARLNPATGNGIVILQTGNPLLATRLASEWVFWEAGRVDFLAFKLAVPGMLRWLGWGSVAIVVLVPSMAWAMWRRRRHRSSR